MTRIKVQLRYGGVGPDGDRCTMIIGPDGCQLGCFFNDSLKRLGLPFVGEKKKRLTAWIEVGR